MIFFGLVRNSLPKQACLFSSFYLHLRLIVLNNEATLCRIIGIIIVGIFMIEWDLSFKFDITFLLMIAVIDLIRIVINILIKEFSLRLFASSFFDDLLSILTSGVDLFDFIMRADASKCESILRWLFVGIVHLLQNIFNRNILFIRMILGYFIELDVFNKQVHGDAALLRHLNSFFDKRLQPPIFRGWQILSLTLTVRHIWFLRHLFLRFLIFYNK